MYTTGCLGQSKCVEVLVHLVQLNSSTMNDVIAMVKVWMTKTKVQKCCIVFSESLVLLPTPYLSSPPFLSLFLSLSFPPPPHHFSSPLLTFPPSLLPSLSSSLTEDWQFKSWDYWQITWDSHLRPICRLSYLCSLNAYMCSMNTP